MHLLGRWVSQEGKASEGEDGDKLLTAANGPPSFRPREGLETTQKLLDIYTKKDNARQRSATLGNARQRSMSKGYAQRVVGEEPFEQIIHSHRGYAAATSGVSRNGR